MEINKVYNENCLETMRRMPSEFVDLVITIPPYDGLRTYNGYSFDFENIAKELYRVVKFGGVVVWIVNDATENGSETGTSFRQALYFKELGFNLHDTMIYQKTSFSYPDKHRYYACFEYMFVFSKGKPKSINLIADKKNNTAGTIVSGNDRQINGQLSKSWGNKNKISIKEYGVRGNIWTYNIGWNHSYKEEYLKNHPAIFPEKLVEDHMKSWSNEGDLVYDPFMGSGTTAKVSILNNRNYIGSELSEEYCKIIQRRVKDAIDKKKLELV